MTDQQAPKRNPSKLVSPLAALAVGLILFAWVWNRTSVDAEAKAKEKVFYNQSVRSFKTEFEQNNAEAILRFENRIEEAFNRWRGITPDFVDDLTDFGSKTKLAGYTIGDLVDKVRRKEVDEKKVEEYVREKFEHHFFSEDELNIAVQKICDDFAGDLEANRKRFYAGLKTDWDAIGLTGEEFQVEKVMDESLQSMQQGMKKLGEEVVPQSVAAFTAGELAAWAGYQLSVQMASQVMIRLGATAGGSTAVGTTGGTLVGGSGGGPVGAVIGVLVGFTGGVLVDWWMTERMQEKITLEINSYLTDMEAALINGSEGKPGVVEFYKTLSQKVVDADVNQVRSLR